MITPTMNSNSPPTAPPSAIQPATRSITDSAPASCTGSVIGAISPTRSSRTICTWCSASIRTGSGCSTDQPFVGLADEVGHEGRAACQVGDLLDELLELVGDWPVSGAVALATIVAIWLADLLVAEDGERRSGVG